MRFGLVNVFKIVNLEKYFTPFSATLCPVVFLFKNEKKLK